MFTRAFARTLRTMKSPHFLGLLIKTAFLTLIIFMLFLAGSGFAMRQFDVTGLGGGAELFADFMLTIGAGVIGWFLLPILLPAIAAFFQETIANSIESKDYPTFMPPAAKRPFIQEILEDCKFVLLFIIANILLFPLFFIPVVGQIAYFVFNGYFIGREFFETAAGRHLGKRSAKELRKEYPAPAFLCGTLIVFCTTIPVVNLVAPFIGVAIMVHLFHLLPKKEEYLPPLKEAESASETP